MLYALPDELLRRPTGKCLTTASERDGGPFVAFVDFLDANILPIAMSS